MSEGGLDQRPPRHDDDVKAWRGRVVPEQLADPTLGPITLDGHPEFPGGGDPKSRRLPGAREREDDHVPALVFPAVVVDLLELGALTDVLVPADPPAWRRRWGSGHAFAGGAVRTSWTRPSGACGPWRGGS